MGGFGVNDQLNSGTYVNNETFHRGFNIAYADGGFIDVSADGNSRLVQDGYLLGYQQAGDRGSGLWMDNGPDQGPYFIVPQNGDISFKKEGHQNYF